VGFSIAIAIRPTIGSMLTEDNCVGHISSESSPKSLNAVESPVNWDETCWLNRKSYFASGIESEMGL
jgi:hypothetical protein